MSTPNFNITRVMDKYDLPLMVQSNEMLYKYIMEEEFNEDLDIDVFYFEVQNGLDCLELDIEADFVELKSELEIFSIELVSGYYSGIQFKIDTADLYFDYLDIDKYEWDEEELWACFKADTVEEAKNRINNELKLIREFLEGMKDYGFRPLNCDGVFSNGEAIYSWAD
jgi:hypothetical protein